MRDSNLVTVGWAYGQAEAALATALLRGAGIAVFADTWYLASVDWAKTHAFQGIALQVPAVQAADAAAILAEHPITRRPRPWQQRLLAGAVMLAAFLLVSLPPPPFGFFPAALRPASSGAAKPVNDPT